MDENAAVLQSLVNEAETFVKVLREIVIARVVNFNDFVFEFLLKKNQERRR